LYISKLELRNIRCFDEITINFSSTKGAYKWGVILGDNGLGKTTILRSIAMGLCGKESVSGLMDELYGEWIRTRKFRGKIRLELISEDKNEEHYSIITEFNRRKLDAPIEIEQTTSPEKNFPWDDLFICGYGASRGIIGDRPIHEYLVTDSTYTLFNYRERQLQNPELVIRRIKDSVNAKSSESLERILQWIDEILMLPEQATKLEREGIDVGGPWGKSMPLLALGDGHQATLTWIVDMLGWALFYDDTMFQKEISGIVLLDEIEQHLHPLWQRSIISLLKNVFPKIQFILTTHSPLVAGNVGKSFKEDPEAKLFYLRRDDDKTVKVSEIEENLGELNCDQILSSEAFGHIYNINPEIENVLREASILAAKDKRTIEEEARYNKFKDKLKEIMFPKGRTLIERIIERDYYKDLEKKIEDFREILKKEENDQN